MPSTYRQPTLDESLRAFCAVDSVFTVTPLYPGLIVPEQGPERPFTPLFESMVLNEALAAARVTDDRWYALEVAHEVYRADPHGGRVLVHRSNLVLYIGREYTVDEIETLFSDNDRPNVLLDNMITNDWSRVVRTRAGNWQPLRPQDVVITVDKLAEVRALAPQQPLSSNPQGAQL